MRSSTNFFVWTLTSQALFLDLALKGDLLVKINKRKRKGNTSFVGV
jgi:hypothetical protein